MLRRFIFLLLVAGVSGTAGLWIGLLYAPAPGEDTREILSAIFDEYETTFNELFELFDRSRQALGDAVDAVTETVSTAGTPDPDE